MSTAFELLITDLSAACLQQVADKSVPTAVVCDIQTPYNGFVCSKLQTLSDIYNMAYIMSIF